MNKAELAEKFHDTLCKCGRKDIRHVYYDSDLMIIAGIVLECEERLMAPLKEAIKFDIDCSSIYNCHKEFKNAIEQTLKLSEQ